MCDGAEEDLGEDKKSKTEAIKSCFTEKRHQCGNENAARQLRDPEVEGDRGGSERRVRANGITGQPASEGILDANVEEDGGGEEEERNGRQRHP